MREKSPEGQGFKQPNAMHQVCLCEDAACLEQTDLATAADVLWFFDRFDYLEGDQDVA